LLKGLDRLWTEEAIDNLRLLRSNLKKSKIVEDQNNEDNSKVVAENFSTTLKTKSNLLFSDPIIQKYKIYAPENTFLRRFEDEEAGDPLGIKGEGLFRLLRYFQTHEDKKYINAIKEALNALDWFEDFKIPDGLASGERKLSIIDRFLDPEVSISQNSANEGFLFILFYISLFVSEDTPSFFAIDNLDASFNPKLCKHITQILIDTAKKTQKQALFTTHNPFILDGLDLTDDEQRLFVVYRNQKGYTIAKRVEPNERSIPLSEQWMKGFLGGLPKNF
jgi:predicted ATPase